MAFYDESWFWSGVFAGVASLGVGLCPANILHAQVLPLGSGGRPAEVEKPALEEVEFGVRLLVGGLTSEDPAVRRAAVKAVGKLGQELHGKPEAVIKLLHDRDPTVRVAAVRAIRDLQGSSAVERLTHAIHDRDRRVQVEAMLAVEALAEHRMEQVPVDALADPFDPFGGSGPVTRSQYVLPPWYAACMEAAMTPAERGMLAIAYHQDSAQIPAAVEMVVRVVAERFAGRPPWDAERDYELDLLPVSGLEACLINEDAAVRTVAMHLVYSREESISLPIAAQVLRDKDPQMRLRAALLLRESMQPTLDEKAKPLVERLTSALDDEHESVRSATATALQAARPYALKPLAKALRRDKSPRVRVRAAWSLARPCASYGSSDDDVKADEVKATLTALAGDDDPVVRALFAIAAVNDPELESEQRSLRARKGLSAAVPVIVAAIRAERRRPLPSHLTDWGYSDANALVLQLAAIGPQAKEAAATLLEDLRALEKLDGDEFHAGAEDQLTCTHKALEEILPDAAPVLVQALDDENRLIRTMAAAALAGNGHNVGRTIPILIESWDHFGWRHWASNGHGVDRTDTWCLAILGKPAVPALVEHLARGRHPDEAAATLASMHEQAAEIVPRLMPLLRNREQDEQRRLAVMMALRFLGNGDADANGRLSTILFDQTESEAIRVAAASAFLSTSGRTPETLKVLQKIVQDENAAVRRMACVAIDMVEHQLEYQRKQRRRD